MSADPLYEQLRGRAGASRVYTTKAIFQFLPTRKSKRTSACSLQTRVTKKPREHAINEMRTPLAHLMGRE